ncbi:MAG: hypothetical protein BVN35_06110 [Proteobacteria bacterium ST_bin11]|nr:MAG: hypothetical protein BVN35_06110 [Proteobacteria bacterium ST_bin11]
MLNQTLDRILKWLLVGMGICLVFTGVKLILEVKESLDVEIKGPTFVKHASRYHSMAEMYATMQQDNDIFPLYGRYDLTKHVQDEHDKIYGYGPMQDPSEFAVRVFLVCNQHGRELVSGEICYSMIRLLQMYVQDGELTRMLGRLSVENVGFWVVPIANPWARHQVEHNDSYVCQRTNERGVDLNRNYPSFIERQEDGDEEEWQGDKPFSEYESLAVAQFLNFSRAHLLFNVHSGGKDIILPYDGRMDVPPNYAVMVDLAKKARTRAKLQDCRVGMSSILYGTTADASLGTLVDYAIDSGLVQLAYTLEVYLNANIQNVGALEGLNCQKFFNPQEGDVLASVQRQWTYYILNLCEELLSMIEK